MTAITLMAAPLVAAVTPTIRPFFGLLSDAVDSFAESRMRNAVPECALRQTDREIRHYRRLMRRNLEGGRDRKASANCATALQPGL